MTTTVRNAQGRMVDRVFQYEMIRPGDWLLTSNDEATLWRFTRTPSGWRVMHRQVDPAAQCLLERLGPRAEWTTVATDVQTRHDCVSIAFKDVDTPLA